MLLTEITDAIDLSALGELDVGELSDLTDIEQINENLNALQEYLTTMPEKLINLSVRVIIAAVVFFIGSKVIKLIRNIVKKSFNKAGAETGVVQFIDGLLKVILYILLVMMIASNFGFDATSVVALVGSAGVTIGLALQGSLSNFAGGVLILMLKPFRVGDYIIEAGSNMEGTVKEIGIFYTKLLTIDGKLVVLPNGNLSNNSITNASISPVRRVDLLVGISYSSDIKKAKEVLLEVMKKDLDVLQNEPITVFVNSLDSSAVTLGMRCFCENPQYWEVRWRLLENAKLSLDENGIEIPFNQMDVHMK
jgi:small conductance mechanosensitive channel